MSFNVFTHLCGGSRPFYKVCTPLFFSGLGPVSRKPRKLFGPVSHSKISNLTITELFYSHILNMNRGSLHTRSFSRVHFSVFRYRWTKTGFTGPKSFRGGFRETGSWSGPVSYTDYGVDHSNAWLPWLQSKKRSKKVANEHSRYAGNPVTLASAFFFCFFCSLRFRAILIEPKLNHLQRCALFFFPGRGLVKELQSQDSAFRRDEKEMEHRSPPDR